MLQKRQPGLAGVLRETVTFQQHALDANGDRLGPWQDVFAAPARVLARTRGEEVLNQRIAGTQPVEITLRLDRFSALVDTDWRAVWLNWPFEITAVAVDELAATVSLLAVRAREVEAALMTITAKVTGGDNMSAKLKDILGDKQKAILKRANAVNAKEFASLVRLAVPQDPHSPTHLADTIETQDVGETGVSVSIGSTTAPYPLHLETGHRMPDGSHVPGKPYWFPAKRVVWKAAKARTLRSYRAAIKSGLSDGGGGS